MATPSPLPTYLYKILSAAPPSPLPIALPLSPLDASDGFIHLSTPSQVPATAARFFADHPRIWLLMLKRVTLEGLEGELKWEESRSHGVFAHLYGANLGKGEVQEVLSFARDGEESWEEVLKGLKN